MAAEKNPTDSAPAIVAWIDHLDHVSLRQLRKAVGLGSWEHTRVSELYREVLPGPISQEDEEAFFCAVTLCAACKPAKEANRSFACQLGAADQARQFTDFLAHILDISSMPLLASQIVHGIRFLNSRKKYLDRTRLVRDILAWSQEERTVQQSWAKEFSSQVSSLDQEMEDPVRGFLSSVQQMEEVKKEAFRSAPAESLRRSNGMALIGFYSALPEKVAPEEEPLFYLVAALSLLNEEPAFPCRDLGASLQMVCTQENEEYLSGIMAEVIQGERSEIFPLLVKSVIYLRNLHVGFCAEKLLNDLLFWDHPARSVQAAWEKSFFG
ncbi:MAG TPA: type I-E CRISPR-associated protein Cse2/CasB [Anaerolineaceae bacterium]|nr:type I-E CRISPR-associated protein Cse2/CasB [Anaerolineaceae bacterium]